MTLEAFTLNIHLLHLSDTGTIHNMASLSLMTMSTGEVHVAWQQICFCKIPYPTLCIEVCLDEMIHLIYIVFLIHMEAEIFSGSCWLAGCSLWIGSQKVGSN